MSLQTMTVTAEEMPRLRVGLKWDPMERDVIAVVHKLHSPFKTQMQILWSYIPSFIYGLLGFFLGTLYFFPYIAGKFRKKRRDIAARRAAKKKFMRQRKLPSYDLDLLCFCYDGDGKLTQLVAPIAVMGDRAPPGAAIMHSGEASTGMGEGFDEEILINLKDVAAGIQQMIFVVASEHHAIRQVKAAACAIINTKNEQPLLSRDLRHRSDHKNFIFARLRRADGGWSLQEIGDYFHIDADPDCPLDDTIDDILRNRYLR